MCVRIKSALELLCGALQKLTGSCICALTRPRVFNLTRLGHVLKQLGHVLNRLHVDAAYAGVTAMLPEMRAHFAGIELVDSFNTNVHKWLLTNMDCSCLWVADSTYVRAALSLLPAYLRGRGNDLDFKVHNPYHEAWHGLHVNPAPSADKDPW